MLFTRTIRRTMVCGLVIVLVMMILLSVSAIYSHFSYRQIIRELNYAFNKCPRKHALTEAIGRLRPALNGGSADPLAVHDRERRFHERLKLAQAEVGDYLFKLQRLPPRPEYAQMYPMAQGMVGGMGDELARIETQRLPALDDPARAAEVAKKLKFEVERLQESADAIPDFQEGIPATLDKASAALPVEFSARRLVGRALRGLLLRADHLRVHLGLRPAAEAAPRGLAGRPRRFQLPHELHAAGRNEGAGRSLQQHDGPLPGNSRRPRPPGLRTEQAARPLRAAGGHRPARGRRGPRNQQPALRDRHGQRIAHESALRRSRPRPNGRKPKWCSSIWK